MRPSILPLYFSFMSVKITPRKPTASSPSPHVMLALLGDEKWNTSTRPTKKNKPKARNRISTKKDPCVSSLGNLDHTPSFSDLRIFSRMASIMNSDRFLYPKPGFSLIKSSTFFRRGSGILTVVYLVAMDYLKRLFKIKIGSNVDVMYSNKLIGGMY